MPEAEDAVVTVLTTEELTDAHRSAVIDVCIAAHDEENFRNLFLVYIKSGGRHFLTYRGSELVSHAVVTTRWVQPEGHGILKTAFIDAVSTLPKYQGLGYGTATIQRLIAEIDDYEVGCLQTDKPGFYDRMGWKLWRGPLAGRCEAGLIPTPEQRGVMVLRLAQSPPLDLDTLLTIEQQPARIWE
jgi:aminoglycoside 2'-N-acetyltransferase I